MTYIEFIESCRHKTINGVVNRHHIIPKCMGGTDEEDNIIELSAEDHAMAHWLLYLENPSVELLRSYNFAKAQIEYQRNYSPEKHGMYGKRQSDESNRKNSEAHKGENNYWYGKHLPDDMRQKISESNKGKTFSKEHRQKISDNSKGKSRNSGENNPMYGKHWYKDKETGKRVYYEDYIL